jgi:hypothetical protein
MGDTLAAARYYGTSQGVAAAVEESVATTLETAREFGLSEWAVEGIQGLVEVVGSPDAPTDVTLTGSSDGSGEVTASCTAPAGTIFSYEWQFKEAGGRLIATAGPLATLTDYFVGLGAWTVRVRARNSVGWSDWTPISDQAFAT